MPVTIDIISGFLGSGKTTLINKILPDLVRTGRLALIENEFGEIGIDGQLFKNSGIEIREVSGGCICCSLFGNFVSAMRKLISQFQPERIIVEPSGVGKLTDVLNAVNAVGEKEAIKINMLIAVVDPLKYEMYSQMFGEFFQNQIQTAQTVILSRTQLADKEDIAKTVNAIKQKNVKAKIMTAPWKQLTGGQIITIAEICQAKINNTIKNGFEIAHHHNVNKGIWVWSATIQKKYTREEFRQKLSKLHDIDTYGTIVRGKGFFQTSDDDWLQYDYVPNEINFKKMDNGVGGSVVIIGNNILETNLVKLFSSEP
jgi:G3E family GTPase